MTFANPTALLWLLLVIPVVVFYVLKIRLKRVPVSTVIFWRQIFDEKKPRSLWQRLRHLLSLLVQLALLAMLVTALTEPYRASEAATARRIVLIVDNSASMSATDVQPSRLAKAKDEARAVADGLRERDEMAVIAAGTQPRVVCGLTGHRRTLRGAVEGIEPSDGPTKLADALALARRLAAEAAGDGKECRIVVVTDACAPDAAALSAGEHVTFVTVGGRAANVGITRFQVRRSTLDPIGYEILVEVTNQSDEPTSDFRLAVILNGRAVDMVPLKLAPNETWTKVLDSTTRDGGILAAELVVKGEKGDEPYPDALPADNKAVAVLPTRANVPVNLYTPTGNLFLQKVLEANPLVVLTVTRGELPKAFPAGGVKVFHKTVPAVLPPGPVLVVDPANDCDLWKVGDPLPTPLVTKQDKESPYMAHVRLDNVLLPDARKLSFTPAAGKPQVLAEVVSADPVFALLDHPTGPVVVLTVNLDNLAGDLPFRTAFPILMVNTLGTFTSTQGELREALPTGATATVVLPGGDFLLRSPDGSTRKLPGGGPAAVGPFDRCGVWAVVPDAPSAAPVDEIAVNLMSKAGSDLRPPDGVKASASAADAGLVGGFGGRPLWWYLAAAAGLLLTVEWFLYQRRWIS